MKNYIRKKRLDLLARTKADDVAIMVDSGYDLIQSRICARYSEITPEFVRRVDLLECLLVTFIEHANNIDALAEIERKLEKDKFLEINLDGKLYC